MKKFLVLLVAILAATAVGVISCSGDETTEESLGTCSTCDALQVEPVEGKVPCNGACEVDPDAGEWYVCVGFDAGAGGHCVPAAENYNMCINGTDDDEDGLVDCDDPDCAEAVPCLCTPKCEGKKCGDDGCDGTCGECAANEVCLDGGTCWCDPKCTGKNCGPDACGGSCGVCPAGMTCSAAGLCEAGPCAPDCKDKVCGNDGCDKTCAPGCGDGQVCTTMGQCVQGPCTKQCGDNECGPDGCGSFCGVCAVDESCVDGLCEPIPCTPDCAVGNKCGLDGCGGSCGTCVAGEVCLNDGTCWCAPACTGKNCGDDGCGKTCGTCPIGMTCEAGLCEAGPCAPKCTGKVCGNDGCGGECEPGCKGDFLCTAEGQCIPKGPDVPGEVCDNGQDDDGDGKMDSKDPDCKGKTVAVLGLYVAYPAFMKTETADGQSWEGDLPGDWTVTVSVLGGEVPTKIWVNTKAVSSATSPQGFVVWDGSTGVAPPAWPVDGGLPVAAGKSFSASFSEAKWFNFELSGF